MTTWLADKSALARLALSPDAEKWALNIQRGRVRVTTVTLLEVGFSARSATDYRATLTESPFTQMPVEYLTPKIEARALEVQLALANKGPAIPDHRGHRDTVNPVHQERRVAFADRAHPVPTGEQPALLERAERCRNRVM